MGSLANNATLVMGLASILERLSVIFAHIFACVLIFYALAKNEAKGVFGLIDLWGTTQITRRYP